MALLIEKNIKGVLGTLDVNRLYIRMQLHLKYSGTNLNVYNKIYLDKNSYEANTEGSNIPISGIPNKLMLTYNRDVDGSDVLAIAHNKLAEYLTTDHKELRPQYDPSTGEPIYIQEPILDVDGNQLEDPSTGELLWQDGDVSTAMEIVVPKFCEPSEISVIDISLGI